MFFYIQVKCAFANLLLQSSFYLPAQNESFLPLPLFIWKHSSMDDITEDCTIGNGEWVFQNLYTREYAESCQWGDSTWVHQLRPLNQWLRPKQCFVARAHFFGSSVQNYPLDTLGMMTGVWKYLPTKHISNHKFPVCGRYIVASVHLEQISSNIIAPYWLISW